MPNKKETGPSTFGSFTATVNPAVGFDTIKHLRIDYFKVLLMTFVLVILSGFVSGFLDTIFAPFDLPSIPNGIGDASDIGAFEVQPTSTPTLTPTSIQTETPTNTPTDTPTSTATRARPSRCRGRIFWTGAAVRTRSTVWLCRAKKR